MDSLGDIQGVSERVMQNTNWMPGYFESYNFNIMMFSPELKVKMI